MDKKNDIPYLTTWERMLHERGGQDAECAIVQRLLEHRFGPLPPDVAVRLHGAGRTQLQNWAERLLDVATLEELFAGR